MCVQVCKQSNYTWHYTSIHTVLPAFHTWNHLTVSLIQNITLLMQCCRKIDQELYAKNAIARGVWGHAPVRKCLKLDTLRISEYLILKFSWHYFWMKGSFSTAITDWQLDTAHKPSQVQTSHFTSLGSYKFSNLHSGYTKVHQTIADLNNAAAQPIVL